jgi:hypothetical protein
MSRIELGRKEAEERAKESRESHRQMVESKKYDEREGMAALKEAQPSWVGRGIQEFNRERAALDFERSSIETTESNFNQAAEDKLEPPEEPPARIYRPFEIYLAKNGNQDVIKVVWSHIANQEPTNPKDSDGNFSFPMEFASVWGRITISNSGQILNPSLVLSPTNPGDQESVKHVWIGRVLSGANGQPRAQNGRFGPIDVTVCRQFWSEAPHRWMITYGSRWP